MQQRVLVTADLPSWDLQLRSDPPSYALGATTNYYYLLLHKLADGLSTVVFVLCRSSIAAALMTFNHHFLIKHFFSGLPYKSTLRTRPSHMEIGFLASQPTAGPRPHAH